LRDRLDAVDRPRGKTLEILIAQLTAAVCNSSLREFKEPLSTKDFMLTRPKEAKPKPVRRLSPKQRKETAENWQGGMQALMKKHGGN